MWVMGHVDGGHVGDGNVGDGHVKQCGYLWV